MKAASGVAKKQYLRMSHIVSLLKQGRKVTVESLVKEFRYAEGPGMEALECSRETVIRDIAALKRLGCDIGYARSEESYYLKNPSWTFDVPAVLDDSELLAIVLGCRFAQEVFPTSVSAPVTQAVNEILRSNTADFMGTAMMDTLKILGSQTPCPDSDVFPAVIEAWTKRRILHIVYLDGKDRRTERDIDPYYLVYHNETWIILGYCRMRKAEHTFMVGRILEATVLPDIFYVDEELRSHMLERLKPEKLFEIGEPIDAKIQVGVSARRRLELSPLHSQQEITDLGDGKYLVTLPGIPMNVVVPWIMRQCGGAIPLEPPRLVEEIRSIASQITASL
ncbi:MAG: HTH domain protein [Lentisphaerae bacterium ADurb.Bin082]|nr:MAG: HTH domain protein [Lentisphaerae bacterium ADurb.Bin082]